MNKQVYSMLATRIKAVENCIQSGNVEWEEKHDQGIKDLMEGAPSGSGFNSGTHLSDASTSEKLVFETAFHHMNENGMYSGWTKHRVTVKASLQFGYRMTISGPNRNGIKEYMYQAFDSFLSEEV